MSIGAYTGLPGSGKSYGVFEHVIVPALKKGKVVFTNIPFDEEKVAAFCGKAPIAFHMDDVRKNPNWFQEVFLAGAVLVLDECWRLWPSGMKATMIPEQHKSFLAEHRHLVGEDGYSTEIFLVTQDLSQLAIFARDLVDTTYRANKLTAIGSSNRFRVDIYDGPVKGPKPPKDKRLREIFGKYKPEIFALYKSHTMSETGEAGDETPTDKRKNIFLGSAFKIIIGVVIFGAFAAFFGLRTVQKFYEHGGRGDVPQTQSSSSSKLTPAVPPPPKKDGFLHGREIRIAMNIISGEFREFTYKVFNGDSYSYVNNFELWQMGYQVKVINQCLVMITGHNEEITAQCYREQEKEGLNLMPAAHDAT